MRRYVVGIVLGTANTVLAYAPHVGDDPVGPTQVAPLAQLVDAGEVGQAPQLPSFAYLPGPHELPEGSLRLPWRQPGDDPDVAVGELAKRQGVKVPGRLVASAKSWL